MQAVAESQANRKASASAKRHVTVKDICMKSGVEGLPDVYESYEQQRRVEWIVWMVIVTAATAVLVWQIVQTWNDFVDNPIISTYSVVADPAGVPFPNVYVCPYNPIHQKRLVESNLDPTWYDKFAAGVLTTNKLNGLLQKNARMTNSILAGFGGGAIVMEIMPPPRGNETQAPQYWVPEDLEEFFKRVGHDKHVLFSECAWNLQSYNCSE